MSLNKEILDRASQRTSIDKVIRQLTRFARRTPKNARVQKLSRKYISHFGSAPPPPPPPPSRNISSQDLTAAETLLNLSNALPPPPRASLADMAQDGGAPTPPRSRAGSDDVDMDGWQPTGRRVRTDLDPDDYDTIDQFLAAAQQQERREDRFETIRMLFSRLQAGTATSRELNVLAHWLRNNENNKKRDETQLMMARGRTAASRAVAARLRVGSPEGLEAQKRLDRELDFGKKKKKVKPSRYQDLVLYSRVQAEAKKKFERYPSIYASSWITREYKKRGGKFTRPRGPGGLKRWYREEWIQVKPYLKNGKKVECGAGKQGKACRPLYRIGTGTPITIPELLKIHSKSALIKLADKKQKDMKGRVNWKSGTFRASR